jgi:hypothetical protein
MTIEPDLKDQMGIICDIIKQFKLSTETCLVLGLTDIEFSYDKIPVTTYDMIICKSEHFNIEHQTIGGNSIIKISDSNEPGAIQMLYYLSACYETVHLYKPELEISSDKYIVCCNLQIKHQMNTFQIPYYFLTRLDDINTIFGHYQLEYMCSKLNRFQKV